jgi:hypothetical protein
LTEGEPEVATVIAQMAVEVVVEGAFASLMQQWRIASSPEAPGLVAADHSFMNERTRNLWHVERRNGLVHESRRVTPDEATRSIKAAQQLVAHIEQIVRSPPKLREQQASS